MPFLCFGGHEEEGGREVEKQGGILPPVRDPQLHCLELLGRE